MANTTTKAINVMTGIIIMAIITVVTIVASIIIAIILKLPNCLTIICFFSLIIILNLRLFPIIIIFLMLIRQCIVLIKVDLLKIRFIISSSLSFISLQAYSGLFFHLIVHSGYQFQHYVIQFSTIISSYLDFDSY